MEALIQYKNSIGFVSPALDERSKRVTLYIPRSNSRNKEKYNTIGDALLDNGFFIQYLSDDQEGKWLSIFLKNCQGIAEANSTVRYALAVVDNVDAVISGSVTSFSVTIRRNHAWQQLADRRIRRPHLSSLGIEPVGKSDIKGKTIGKEEIALDLGLMKVIFRSIDGTYSNGPNSMILNLTNGRFEQPFELNKAFLKAARVTQPFIAPVRIIRKGRVECGFIRPRILNHETLSNSVKCILNFEMFHHGLPDISLVNVDLKDSSQTLPLDLVQRKVLEENWIEIDKNNSEIVDLNISDTLGRPQKILISGQKLRFFVIPNINRQVSIDNMSLIDDASLVVEIVPDGVFPILEPSGKPNVRRLKLGPSNAEFLEIQGSKISSTQAGIKFDPSVRSGGFLLRAAEKFIKNKTMPDEFIDEHITDWVSTVWPSYISLNASGEPIEKTIGAVRVNSEWIYATQPDNMILYGGEINDPNLAIESDRRQNYRKDSIGWIEQPLPFTFFHGLDSGEMDGSKPSDIESYLAQHRAKIHRNYMSPVAKSLALQSLVNKKPGVTPQTFVIDRYNTKDLYGNPAANNSSFWRIELAKAKQGTNLSLSMLVKAPQVQSLFMQNEFNMVLPGGKIWINQSVEEAIEFQANFYVSEWSFNVGFGSLSTKPNASIAAEINPDTIVVLKYTKGSLENILRSPATWGNRSLLKNEWIESIGNVVVDWLKKISDRSNEHPDTYAKIKGILTDEDWTGILIINPVVDMGNLPSSLQAISSGLNLELFRANHFGFTLNRIDYSNQDAPKIDSSSMFGLIDYYDCKALGDHNDEFDFKVESLLVKFENSEVQDFQSALRIRLPSFFDEPINNVKGGEVIQECNGEQESPKVFKINGVYESRRNELGKTSGRYSFIYENDILLTQSGCWIFESVKITRVELRSDRTKLIASPTKGCYEDTIEQKKVESSLVIDCEINFKKDGKDSADTNFDILSFEKISITGMRLAFETTLCKDKANIWKQNKGQRPTSIKFETIRVEADPDRRRPDGFLKNFPVKYKSFLALGSPKNLNSQGFMSLVDPDKDGTNIKFGLEFDVDFGSLAKLIGFDADLKAVMLVAWQQGSNDKDPTVVLGLKFPEQGGRALDLDLGFLGVKSSLFSIFKIDTTDENGNSLKQLIMVANDLRVRILSTEFPSDKKTEFGLVLAPALGKEARTRPLGWMTSLKTDRLFFIENLFIALGQRFQLKSKFGQNPKTIVKNVKNLLSDFSIKGLKGKELREASKDYQKKFKESFNYSSKHEWFAALSGEAASGAGKVYALYNPPTMFGGALDLSGLFEISILYKQLTEQVGLWSGSLMLDDNISSIDVGAVRLQIPRITVELDTDGGFGLNIGLNVNQPDDFSDAAAAEVTVFKGDGGVYYSKLNGAAFSRMPRVNHTDNPMIYSPVTQILLAGRFGLGREFKKSILKAGASITIYGILSGMWGKKNAKYKGNIPKNIWDRLPNEYSIYYGEIGVIAEIYGILDFKITSLRFEARLLVGYGLQFETWMGVIAYIRGQLRFSVRWVIARFKIFGKTITISTTLKFQTEFRQEYALQKPMADYGKYFIRNQQYTLNREEQEFVRASTLFFDRNVSPVWPPIKQSLTILSTLDITLNDFGKPMIIPITAIPYSSESSKSGAAQTTTTGEFYYFVRFIFEWSLAAMFDSTGKSKTSLPNTRELSLSDLIKAESLVTEFTSKYGQRGEWAADSAWNNVLNKFKIKLKNDNTAFSPEQPVTSFPIPGTIQPILNRGSKDVPLDTLCNTDVTEEYIRHMNEVFENLGVPVRDVPGKGMRTEHTTSIYAIPIKTKLSSFLFEEYLDVILQGIWNAFSNHKWETGKPILVADLRNLLQTNADDEYNSFLMRISGMANQQRFGGMRVPPVDIPTLSGKEVMPIKLKDLSTQITLSLCDVANQRIPYQSLAPFKHINSLTLEYAALPNIKNDNKVIYKWDHELEDISKFYKDAHKLLQIHEKNIILDYGKKNIHTRHTIVEDLEVINGLKAERMLALPKSLQKNSNYRSHTKTTEKLKDIKLYNKLPPGSEDNQDRAAVEFLPVLMLRLPVRSIPGQDDSFELLRFKEADRQLLTEFIKKTLPSADLGIDISVLKPDYYESNGPTKGELHKFEKMSLDLKRSYIGRVNLSAEPNPTDLDNSLNISFNNSVPIRTDFSDAESVLKMLAKAAVVNSGGYIIHTDENPSVIVDTSHTKELMIRFILSGKEINNKLARGTNWIQAYQKDNNSLSKQLMLQEVDSRSRSSKAPGIMSLKISRRDPTFQFSAVTRKNRTWISEGPATLSLDEVLAHIEISENRTVGSLNLHTAQSHILSAAGKEAIEIAERFNLLQLSIIDSDYFNSLDASNDLPTPPHTKDNNVNPTDASGKKRDDYEYDWSFPIYKLAKRSKITNELNLGRSLKGKDFIYAGIGHPVHIRVSFRDIHGYTPLNSTSELSMASEANIIRTLQYSDSLVTIASIPYMKIRYGIVKGQLTLTMHFDSNVLVRRELDSTACPPIKEDGEEFKARLDTLYSTISLALQQTHDKNVTMKIECPLKFIDSGSDTYKLNLDERTIYGSFLKDSLDAVVDAINGKNISSPVNVRIIGPISFMKNTVDQPIVSYSLSFKLSRPVDMVSSQLRDSNSEIYSQSHAVEFMHGKKDGNPHLALEKSIKSISAEYHLAYGKSANNEETFYVIHNNVLKLTPNLSSEVDEPAYAGIVPLATRPYSNPTAQILLPTKGSRSEVSIADFDQDETYSLFCADLDSLSSPEVASDQWKKTSTLDSYTKFISNKDELAKATSKRISNILDYDKARVDTAKNDIVKKFENSLRKRLRAISELDAAIAIPYKYRDLSTDDQILIYGNVNKDDSIVTTNESDTSSFSQIVFDRKGNEGIATVMFDSKNEARIEIAKFTGVWSITHLRWSKQELNTQAWMTLVSPKQILMTRDINKPLQIPIVFRKLVKKPSLKHSVIKKDLYALSSWRDIVERAKEWRLGVDIKREGAAFQDDVIINLDFNVDPFVDNTVNLSSKSKARMVGEILYEFSIWRDTLQAKSVDKKIKKYTDWIIELTNALSVQAAITASSATLQRRQQKLLLTEKEHDKDLRQVKVQLFKHKNTQEPGFDHTQFCYDIGKLSNNNDLEACNTRSSNSGLPNQIGHTEIKSKLLELESGGSEYFSGRRITVDKLNIFEYESVRTNVKVVRNHTLEKGNKIYDNINSAFHYESEEILTPSTLTPYREVVEPIHLDKRPLKDSLKRFFNLLFKEIDKNKAIFKIEADFRPEIGVRWGYDSTELEDYKLEDLSLNIYGPDQISSLPPRVYSKDRNEEISEIYDSILQWQLENGVPKKGYYSFDIEIFARLGTGSNKVPRPVLRFYKVRVPASNAI